MSNIKWVICLMVCCILLTGCYDRREVDDEAYVIAIGLDKGKTNALKITLKIAVPTVIAGGGDPEKSATYVTLESPSFFSGLNLANTFISKQMNLSHTKAIIISKELAQEGIGPYLRAFPRSEQLRPNMFFVISRDSAETYIRNIEPLLETNPAKYLELNYRAYLYTAFTANTQLHHFSNHLVSLDRQPFAILAGVNKYDTPQDFTVEDSTIDRKDRTLPLEGDFLAGNMPKVNDIRSEIMGLAVFKGDKMVGELDGTETTYHLMVMGEFHRAFITIPDPLVPDRFIVTDVVQSRPPTHKVVLENGKPQIIVRLALEADIMSIQSEIDYARDEYRQILEKAYKDFFAQEITQFLTRTAQELESDICGFGKSVKRYFLTWQEWESFNWLEKYKDSIFDVQVDFKIRRPGLIVRTSPIRGN